MLRWQQNCIDQNLTKLVEYTKCNVSLLAILREKNIISEEEHESLGDESRGSKHRALDLYRLVKTRTMAFEGLKDALIRTHQSGAFQVLNESHDDNDDYSRYKMLDYHQNEIIYDLGSTIKIHKGKFGNRQALVKVFNNLNRKSLKQAKNELDILTELDWHDHVVRCFIAKFITRGYSKYFAIALDYQTNLTDFSRSEDIMQNSNDLMHQTFLGVKFLHQQHIIHANLRPKSILIVCRSETFTKIKIGEFGLSQKLPLVQRSVSMPMKLLKEKGDSSFCTPEVLLLAENLNSQDEMDRVNCPLTLHTDVFCLGVILYFIVSGGRHPFGGLVERFGNVRNNRQKVDQDVFSSLSFYSKETLLKMLSTSPTERPDLDSLVDAF